VKLEQINLLVTDSQAPEAMVAELRTRGLDIVIVPDE